MVFSNSSVYYQLYQKSKKMNKTLLILFLWIQSSLAVFANEVTVQLLQEKEVLDIELYHEAYSNCKSISELDSLNAIYNKTTDPAHKTINLLAYSKALSKRGKSNVALEKLTVLTPYLSKFSNFLLGEYYATISSINYFSENPKKAREYLKRSLEYTLKSNNKRALHARYSSYGVVHLALNNVDSAFVYFEKAEQLNSSATVKNRLYLELNIALANSTIRNYEKAKTHFKKAIESFSASPDLFAEVRTYGNLGDIYLQQDSLLKGKELFLFGLKLAEQNGYVLGQIRFHKSLADVLKLQHKPDEAFEHLTIYQNLRDQLSMEETSQQIEEIDMNFKLMTKEQEKKNQARLYQLESQKTGILWVFAIVLMIALTILYRQLIIVKSKNETLYHLGQSEKSLIEKKKVNEGSYSEIIGGFESLMIEKRIFEKSNITIDSVAKKLGTNRSYLSEAINVYYNVNFSRWVNELRVQESKKFLSSEKYDCYCIDGISKMVGFSSISSFNSNFKSITGLTPSFYRKRSLTA